jgi:hypothetical protein
MGIANKPLLDRFFDQEVRTEFGLPMRFSDNAPRDKVQTFVLSPEVALAAETLVRSPTFKPTPLDELHMPYEHTAIEYPLTPAIRKLRENGVVDGVTPVTRVGAYIREMGEGVFTCLPYWEYIDGRIQHSLFVFMFGLPIEQGAQIKFSARADGQDSTSANFMPCLSFIKAAQAAKITPQMFAQITQHDPQVQQHIMEAATEVSTLLFATYLLLNCKSGVGQIRVAALVPPKGLKLGGKKKKAYSASAYTLLHLQEVETVTTTGLISQRADVAAHYVRGHFKQRKSGLYWWGAFVRGTGTLRKRTAYKVEGC